MQPAIKCVKWTKREVDLVRHLISIDGMSFQEVADRFLVTKSSILGLCRRNGIKHSEEYLKSQHQKPVVSVPKKLGEIIERECPQCSRVFKAYAKLEKRFCNAHCSMRYHNKRYATGVEPNAKIKRAAYLQPSPHDKRCRCGSYAVPNHLTCYERKRECYV